MKYSNAVRITTPCDSYVTLYPDAIKFAETQQAIFWTEYELGLQKDMQCIRTELNEAELHGLMVSQGVLTKLESIIGEEYWRDLIPKCFPRHEIARMAACFSNVELSSHAPFYTATNKLLGKDTDEFYLYFLEDDFLRSRFETISSFTKSDDELVVTAALSFIEGVSLFSIFGYFMSFNRNGWNFIPSFCGGINGSSRDENLHSLGSVYLHNTTFSELIEAGYNVDTESLSSAIRLIANAVRDIEFQFAKELFRIPGCRPVTLEEVQHFIEDRVNLTLQRLNQKPLSDKPTGAISEWFYTTISTTKNPDFFSGTQLEYRRDWDKSKLVFKKSK